MMQLQEDIQSLAQKWKNQDLQLQQIRTESVEELLNSLEELWVAEEELSRQSEELLAARSQVEAERQRYYDLYEFAPDGGLITGLTGKIVEANRSAAYLLNVPQASLIGKFLPQFIPLDDRQTFRQRMNELRGGVQALRQQNEPFGPRDGLFNMVLKGYTDWEVRLQPRQRGPIDVSMKVALFQQDQVDYLRWSLRDISDRVAAQQALQAREIQFRTLAETSAVAIFLVVNGSVAYANQTGCQITSRTLAELHGMEFKTLIHPDDRSHFQLSPTGAAHPFSPKTLDKASIRRELKLNSQEGEECRVDMTAGFIVLEDQPAWVVTAYDITPRVLAENTHRELSQRILSLQEEERRRISRELHDQMGQNLTALTLGLKSLEDAAAGEPNQLKTLRRLQAIAKELSQEVHRVAYELRPSALDDIGLASTLSNYLEEWSDQYAIEVDMEGSLKPELPLPPQTAMAIFRIV